MHHHVQRRTAQNLVPRGSFDLENICKQPLERLAIENLYHSRCPSCIRGPGKSVVHPRSQSRGSDWLVGSSTRTTCISPEKCGETDETELPSTTVWMHSPKRRYLDVSGSAQTVGGRWQMCRRLSTEDHLQCSYYQLLQA